MFLPIRTCWAFVALAGLIWNPAAAQEAAAPVRDEMSDSVREMYVELRSLQHRMAQLGNLALQESPEVAQRWQSLQRSLDRAMTEIDPDAGDDLERLEGTRDELKQAWAARDMDRLRSLLDERRGLRRSLQSVQAEAFLREDVVAAMDAFGAALVTRIRESELDALMARMEYLTDRLRSLSPDRPMPPESREGAGSREPSDRR